ncbi:Short-chain dehydrogenase/reductase SDR [Alloactinosynnema sp. L-07]|uniref:SDR family NAD(P)-dependent oxidoreductase n=1 Tax=Alloactinosynnema sp. L-07 TaxID=1653480 RepID=UPI00065F03DC|nr:SDR family NAD(P)-dependent oxidoreductase [Alloactinosynnema sp. L-07]CRK57835.1 Short-chain dehydrogenase/reductase SDR [Alloactinosynnema sp. L-07]
MTTLLGTVAMVTGAGTGVGAAVAHRLDALGALVAALDVEGTGAEVTAGALHRAMAVKADPADPAQLEAAIKSVHAHYGRLDVVVTTSSRPCQPANAAELSDHDWHTPLADILDTAFYALRAVLHTPATRVLAVIPVCAHNPARAAASAGAQALSSGTDRLTAVVTRCPADLAATAAAVARLAGATP